MLLGVLKLRAEEFSFALAVIITPPLIAYEVWRSYQKHGNFHVAWDFLGPSLVGMAFAFLAGLVALEMAVPLAGRWPLVSFWNLLPGSVGGSIHTVLQGLLRTVGRDKLARSELVPPWPASGSIVCYPAPAPGWFSWDGHEWPFDGCAAKWA